MGYVKLFRFMSVMMVQTKCKSVETALGYSSNCSILRAKKLETKSTTKKQENSVEKWESEISPEYRC